MANQIDCTCLLLATGISRPHGGATRWHPHHYDLGNFFWTVMRYFLRKRPPPLAA